MRNNEEIKQKILKILESHPEGLPIIEISKLVNAHRQTVAKYVMFLEALGQIVRRDIGPVSLHYHSKHYSKLTKSKRRMS